MKNNILALSTLFAISSLSENKGNSYDIGSIQFSPITLSDEYRKKWNIHERDFICLTKNGELISNSLYRIGGFGADLKNDYFMLIKQVEALYDDAITKDETRKHHLEGRWVILNMNGVEKVEICAYKHPYITKNSCIYSIDSNYYNIETGEFYCNASTSMCSSEYLFLDNRFDKDKSKRGVMKINLKNGSWELFN